MNLLRLILLPVLAALVSGQSAPDFPVTVEANLAVTYTDTGTDISPPGLLVPRRDVLTVPTVYAPTGATARIYLLLMIDQDVPRNGSKVALLHWLQPNLVASPDALSVVNIMDGASTAVGAEYIPPTPPAGSGPHRYTFVLFEQPSLWVIPAEFVTINPPADTSARIGFNITEFITASGLNQPLAANYLQVLNGTSAESSSAAAETYVAATSVISSTAAPEASATSSTSMTASTTASVTSESGPATSAAASETAAATDGAVVIRGNTKELLVGLAMGAVGAGLWML